MVKRILGGNTGHKTAIITDEFFGSSHGATIGITERFDLNCAFIQQTHWSYIESAGGAISLQDDVHRSNLDKLHKTLGTKKVRFKEFLYLVLLLEQRT